jgi:hypothetical protein
MVASWDNLSGKGCMCQGFDRILVWNEPMREEVLRYYPGYREQQVVATGIPRFDVYRDPLPPHLDREPFFRSLGLDPARQLLLFANTATRLIPEQPQVIAHVAAAIADGTLARNTQLLVRCHPRDPVDLYMELARSSGVSVWHPQAHDGDLYRWLPDVDHLAVLAAMIKHSVATMNPCSTMTLDAVMCDRPVASIAYDGDAKKRFEDSIASAYHYNHLAPVLRSGAAPLCKSREELLGLLNRYIADPGMLRNERRRLAVEVCLADRGPAVELLNRAIVEWAVARGVLRP